MRVPEGIDGSETRRQFFRKLECVLYGLKQAGRRIHVTLEGLGY